MNENILSTAVLPDESKPLVGIVHFNRPDGFRHWSGIVPPLRSRTQGRAPGRFARQLGRTRVALNQFGDLGALLPLADSDLDPSAFGNTTMPCCLKMTD